MPFVKFNGVRFGEAVNGQHMHFGYPCELRGDAVYGDVPEELLEHEAAAGRIVLPAKTDVETEVKVEGEGEISAEVVSPDDVVKGRRRRKSKEVFVQEDVTEPATSDDFEALFKD